MSDYIKRSEAISEAIEAANVWDGWYITRRAEMITAYLNEKIPAADVRENVSGDWLHTDAVPHRVYCSVCYETYLRNEKWAEELPIKLHPNYCPNCGARMRPGYFVSNGNVAQGR